MPPARPTAILDTPEGPLRMIDLRAAAAERLGELPWSLRLLLENVLRTAAPAEAEREARALLDWCRSATSDAEISFQPGRILMHDTTCVPALVDIAAMRDVVAEAGGEARLLNPVIQVDAVIDHSVAVDHFGTPEARARNMAQEIARNAERYRFMKWATGALDNFRLFPPGVGILHTVNLEHLAQVVATEQRDGETWAVPDSLVGTDSHTPMINALGVLGWGVGGIEAESAMFGVPITLRIPDVIGVRLTGALKDGVLATDLALAVTERLRQIDAVDSFVEFFGPGVSALAVGERAVIANMAPEYGATMGFFPIDARTIDYLRATGRAPCVLARVEAYARRQGLWFDPAHTPRYTQTIEIDLSTVRPNLAGPRRPQDRVDPAAAAAALAPVMRARGRPWPATPLPSSRRPGDGAIAIAAITSCTNTADAKLLIAAGLLARKARRHGLRPPSYVKTSFAPGSGAVLRLLERAGLLDDLAAVGFDVVGIGCTTCIGNSGPLTAEMMDAIDRDGIVPVAVLSGNRNFPGRIHSAIEAAFLASPPLVVAYALAGRVDLDITADPIASGEGGPVRLADLWPAQAEIEQVYAAAARPDDTVAYYAQGATDRSWATIEAPTGVRFPWDARSTYLRRPPFVARTAPREGVTNLRAAPLIVLGDDVTTDHISPAGAIPATSDAGRYLREAGENPRDLNVYAARRGNFEVMVRGLFTNPAARNLLCPEAPAGMTVYAPSGEILPIWRAAERYRGAGQDLVIVAGHRYGTGSSRDWAAKGPRLLGVRAVLANSFERIHRSNLVGMGILPIELPADRHPAHLALTASDRIVVAVTPEALEPDAAISVAIHRADGGVETLSARLLLRTAQEAALIRSGGVIPYLLGQTLDRSRVLPTEALS
ncbi:MAG: aconitate hydratase AcnA [Variibacter sp.]|nr:aconitate hydratase AcnA [Variibacter sp.]